MNDKIKIMEKIYHQVYTEGMSQKQACEENNIPPTTFNKWKYLTYPKTPRRRKKSWRKNDYLRIKELIDLEGYTQKEACEEIDMPTSTYSMWNKKYREKIGETKQDLGD